MVNKDVIINEGINFIKNMVNTMTKDNFLLDLLLPPIVDEIIENNIDTAVNFLNMIADKDGNINVERLLNRIEDKLIVSTVQKINGVEIGNGNIKFHIAGINKDLIVTHKDIERFKNQLTKYNS